MKRNVLKNASLVALSAMFFCAVFTSCSNSSDKSSTADTSKMTTGDTSTMKSTPMAPMNDTMSHMNDTSVHKGDQKMPAKDTSHKGDQKSPPRN